jgi:hypothetical protein
MSAIFGPSHQVTLCRCKLDHGNEDLAHTLFYDVHFLHGVPWVILSDWDCRFDFDFSDLLPLCKAQYFACLRSTASEASPEVLFKQAMSCVRPAPCPAPCVPVWPFYTSVYVCNPSMLAAHLCPAVLAATYLYNTLTAHPVVPCFSPVSRQSAML